MIEFSSPSFTSSRRHCPMQGPQALASTMPPTASKSASWPSRRIVWWICSEPGVTQSFVFARAPCAVAWRATSAARSRSSYEEFVQLPISAEESAIG